MEFGRTISLSNASRNRMDFYYAIVTVANACEIIRGSRVLCTSTTWCMATSTTTWSETRA